MLPDRWNPRIKLRNWLNKQSAAELAYPVSSTGLLAALASQWIVVTDASGNVHRYEVRDGEEFHFLADKFSITPTEGSAAPAASHPASPNPRSSGPQ